MRRCGGFRLSGYEICTAYKSDEELEVTWKNCSRSEEGLTLEMRGSVSHHDALGHAQSGELLGLEGGQVPKGDGERLCQYDYF